MLDVFALPISAHSPWKVALELDDVAVDDSVCGHDAEACYDGAVVVNPLDQAGLTKDPPGAAHAAASRSSEGIRSAALSGSPIAWAAATTAGQ